MGSHSYTSSPTTARLSMLISRPTTPPEDPLPPPPPHTAVSVPFKWEEAPGKPRVCHTRSEPSKDDDSAKTLELPPRLLFLDGPSPTTVLGGPYVGRAVSFSSSYRTPRDYWAPNFGSARWSSFRKVAKEEDEGIFDFSGHKVKMNSIPRRRSSLSLSHQSKATSHFWASIYESFKQMVPWRRKQQKQRKWASKLDTTV